MKTTMFRTLHRHTGRAYRFAAVLLAGLLALSLAACGSSSDNEETTTSASSKAKETTTEAVTEEQSTQQAQDTASKTAKVYAMAGDMDEASTLSAWEVARGGLAETSVAGLYTMTAEDGTSVYVSFDGETVSEISEEEAGVQTQRAEEQAARQAASQAASASSGSSSNAASASTSNTTSGSTASNKTSSGGTSGTASNKTSSTSGSDTSGNETTKNTASNKTSGTNNNSQSTQSNASSQSSSLKQQATTQSQTEAATQAQTQTATQPETQTTAQPQTEAATQTETQTETTHEHNWTAVYKEQLISAAWDEYEYQAILVCNNCGTVYYDEDSMEEHWVNVEWNDWLGYSSSSKIINTIHHPADYETVVDYYKCSCGATKAEE